MHRPLLLTRSVAVLLVAGGLNACSGGDDAGPGEVPLPTIADARLVTVPVQPAEFCERIDERAVELAVGDDPETAHYANGERAEVAPGIVDVAHEHGCVFTGTDGSQARAWVVVPPITPKRAADFRPGKGCEVFEDEGLGEPGFAARCEADDVVTLSLAGLYTDVWFGCSLAVPGGGGAAAASDPPDETRTPQARLEAWCAAAVQAAATDT